MVNKKAPNPQDLGTLSSKLETRNSKLETRNGSYTTLPS